MAKLDLIAPQFQESKIIIPAIGEVWTPKKWSGDVVVHAPMSPDLDELFRAINQTRAQMAMDKNYALFQGRDYKQPLPIPAGGAAGSWTFTNNTRTNLLNGNVDIDTDTFKMALHLSTSDISATENAWSGVTGEHSAANGYTAGGASITLTLSGTTTVTVDISTDPVWTASGGSITARYAIIYEVSNNVLCYALLDSTPADVTATDGNTLTVAAHASGVFTLA